MYLFLVICFPLAKRSRAAIILLLGGLYRLSHPDPAMAGSPGGAGSLAIGRGLDVAMSRIAGEYRPHPAPPGSRGGESPRRGSTTSVMRWTLHRAGRGGAVLLFECLSID